MFDGLFFCRNFSDSFIFWCDKCGNCDIPDIFLSHSVLCSCVTGVTNLDHHNSLFDLSFDNFQFQVRNFCVIDAGKLLCDCCGMCDRENNHGIATPLWTMENGLKCIGGGHNRAIGLLSDGTVAWSVTGSENSDGFVFQKEDQIFGGFVFHTNDQVPQFLRLPLNRSRQPLAEYLGKFSNMKVQTSILFGTWPLSESEFNVNDKRQIFFTGEIFGEQHPFLIEPVSN